jgi:hypothetical protein
MCSHARSVASTKRSVLLPAAGPLGDGHLAAHPRTWRLVISCDAAYPGIVEDCRRAVERTGLPRRVRAQVDATTRCVRVVVDSRRWPEAFPQHGPGRKHDRKIELADWQREVVDRFPEEFLRGLLHSDGCRTVNRFKTTLPSGRVAEYAYPRWFFSNRSEDIRGLFCEYCERLGIRWTQSNPRNISVSHRRSVALLDAFVPAKS